MKLFIQMALFVLVCVFQNSVFKSTKAYANGGTESVIQDAPPSYVQSQITGHYQSAFAKAQNSDSSQKHNIADSVVKYYLRSIGEDENNSVAYAKAYLVLSRKFAQH